jgi:hypothetical protein
MESAFRIDRCNHAPAFIHSRKIVTAEGRGASVAEGFFEFFSLLASAARAKQPVSAIISVIDCRFVRIVYRL